MEKILRFVKHPTSINVLINTFGNYLNVFFSLLFVLILVRVLDLQHYGVLNVLLGIAYVLANILDFGTTATIYSYLPNLYQQKSANLYRFVKSTFYYQSLFSLIVIGILFITFPYLDKIFFKTHEPIWELYITAISVLFFIWQNFALNMLNAAKKFLQANIYLNLSNLIKTIVIIALAWLHMVSVGSIIFVFGILGPLLFFVLLLIEKKDLVFIIAKAEVRKEEFRFQYTMTYFIASQFFNVATRMDLFLLSFYGLRNETGTYGLAQKIILTIITTVVSITQVLSPGFSAIKKKKDVFHHLKTGTFYLLLPSALFLLLNVIPPFIYIALFKKPEFTQSAHIAAALSIPYVLYTLGSIPSLFLLYTIKKPHYILLTNIIFFIIVTIGCIITIPKEGVYGPPHVFGYGFGVAFIVLALASIYEYKKMPAT